MNAREITEHLGGTWHGRFGLVPAPGHSPQDRSVKIWENRGAVLIHSFAGECWRTIKAEWCRQRLLPGWAGDAEVDAREAVDEAAREEQRMADIRRRKDYARKVWDKTRSAVGSPVERYLRSRAITLPIPPAIRFAASLKHGPTGVFLPAMVSAVVDVAGRLQGAHRTFLEPVGCKRLQRDDAKMSLGLLVGGAVRLAPAAEELAICEGLETALSVQQASGLPTWAALSAPGIQSLQLPPEVRDVVIAVDGDRAGRRAGRIAARRWMAEGRRVRIADPGNGRDFNDLLMDAA